MPYSAKSDDANTISQFVRRKSITITTDGTSTPVNYQVKLTIAYEPGMQADFDDVRFNTKTGIYINYWIETHTESTTATVWIELPDAITDPGSDTIWMYYGNQDLGSNGDIEDTFLFGDDFPGSAIDTEKWTVTGTVSVANSEVNLNDNDIIQSISTFGFDTIVTSKAKADEQDSTFVGYYTDIDNRIIVISSDYTSDDDFDNIMLYTIKDSVGSETIQNDNWFDFRDTYYQYTLKRISTSLIEYSQDINSNSYTNSAHIPIGNMSIYMYVWSQSSILTCDWIFVRKYIANEPIPSYGSPQHQRIVSKFIG